jgi:[acyl-carrier-protein] S-malonyltransferase
MILGFVDGSPLPRTELDRRLAAARTGPRAGALPAPGSAEDRQFTRWVAQVVLTEALCEAEAATRDLDPSAAAPARLDQRAAVELGSITAAAFEGSSAVRAVYHAVTAGVTVPAETVAAYRSAIRPAPVRPGPVWRLSGPDGVFEAAIDSLPTALADPLRAAAPGRNQMKVGGWAATRVRPAGDEDHDPVPGLVEAARRVTFVRWLDHARAHRIRLVAGLEHPGDPGQPDNHHRH